MLGYEDESVGESDATHSHVTQSVTLSVTLVV